MAIRRSKKKLDTPPNDDLFLDLDSLEDDFDFSDGSSQGRTRRFLSGFRRGFLDETLRRNTASRLAAASLPNSYTRIIPSIASFQDSVREINEKVKDQNTEMLLEFVQHGENAVGKMRGRAPRKLQDLMEQRIKGTRENLEREVDYKRRQQRDVYRDKEDNTSQEIAEQLAAIQAQSDFFQSEQQQQNADNAARRDSVKMRLAGSRFDVINRHLLLLNDGIQQQVNFQDNVTYRYQRKSLELSYRKMFLLRDIRKLTGASLELHRRGYEAVIHNTGLPGHLLIKEGIRSFHTRHLADMVDESGAQGIRSGFSYGSRIGRGLLNRAVGDSTRSLPEFLNEFYPTVRENIVRTINDRLAGLDSLSSMSGMLGTAAGEMGKAENLGNVAGGLSGALAKSIGIPKVAKALRPFMEKAGGRLNGRNHLASYLINNAPSLLQDYVEDFNQGMGAKGILQDFVRSIIPTYHFEDRLKNGSYSSIDGQAVFNQLTQRSIVEIIPGYLSRMLQEIRILRTGDERIGREVYDLTSGRFTGMTKAKTALQNRIVPEVQRQQMSDMLDYVVTRYDPEKTLSDDAREALRERLMRDAARGNRRFDPKAYSSSYGYDESTAQETVDELSAFFNSRFKYDDKGRLLRENDNLSRLNEFSDVFLELRNVVPNVRQQIETLHGTGSQELLRELGLVTTEYGEDRINFNRIFELYREGSQQKGSASSPLPPEETKRPTLQDHLKHEKERLQKAAGEHLGKHAPTLKRHRAAIDQRVKPHRDALQDAIAKRRESIEDRLGINPRDEVKRAAKELEASYGDRWAENEFNRSAYGTDEDTAKPTTPTSAQTKLHRLEAEYRSLKEHLKNIETPNQEDFRAAGRTAKTRLLNSRDVVTRRLETLRREMDRLRSVVMETPTEERPTTTIEDELSQQATMRERLARGFERVQDLYVKGRDQVVLLARDLKAGEYFDAATGEVVTRYEQIRGALKDRFGNTVLTEEEFQEGLHTVEGEEKVKGSGWRRYFDITTRPLRFLSRLAYRGVRAAGSALLSGVAGIFRSRDAYLEGEDTPRIRARLFKQGKYFNAETGEPLTDMTDIRSAIADEEGNILVSEEELPHLVTVDGEKHPMSKRLGAASRALRWAGKKYWNFTKSYYKGLGKLAMKALPTSMQNRINRWIGDPSREVNDESIETPTDGLLMRIYDTLRRRLPEEGPRRGSWQDIFAKRAEKKSAGETDEPQGEGGFRDVFKQLGAIFGTTGVGGLLGRLFGKKEEEPGAVDEFGSEVVAGAAGAVGGSLMEQARHRLGQGARATWRFGRQHGGTALRWAGRGLMTAGATTVATLGLPVVAGGAAAVGVAAGGYYLWQRHQQTAGKLLRMRMAQYGADPGKRSEVIPILETEALIEQHTHRSNDGQVRWNMNGVDIRGVLAAFDVDENNPVAVRAFVDWFDSRFKTVYFAHQEALAVLAPNVKLTEVDEELPTTLRNDYLDEVRPDGSLAVVFTLLTSPYNPEEALTMTLERAMQYWRDARGEERTESAASVDTSGNVFSMSTARRQRRNQRREENQRALQEREGVVSDTTTPSGRQQRRRQNRSTTHVSNVVNFNPRSLTDLQKLRLHAYGLSTVESSVTSALLGMEDTLGQYLDFERDRVTFTGDHDEYLREFTGSLGFHWSSSNQPQIQQWRRWFRERWLPTFLAYANTVHQISSSLSLTHPEQGLDRGQITQVARAIMGAQYTEGEEPIAVWELDNGVLGVHQSGARALEEAEKLLLLIETNETSRSSASTQTVAQQQSNTQRQTTQAATNNVVNLNHHANRRRQQRSSSSSGGGNTARSGGGGSAPTQPGGGLRSLGNGGITLAQGNGGAWEEIPMPTSNGSRQAAMRTLAKVAEMSGVSADLLATFIQMESNFDYNARPTGQGMSSSAMGWGQFLGGTWLEMLDKHAGKYGIPTGGSREDKLRLRLDPRINALMLAEFLKGNFNFLQSRLGRTPTDTDLYLAHFLGAGGASRFLSQDRNTVAARVFSREAASNRPVFYKDRGRGEARTIGEIYAMFNEKIARHRQGGGSSSMSVSDHQERPQVDMSGVEAMANREVIQVAPIGSPEAFMFTDDPRLAERNATPITRQIAPPNDPMRTRGYNEGVFGGEQPTETEEGVNEQPARRGSSAVTGDPMERLRQAQQRRAVQQRTAQQEVEQRQRVEQVEIHGYIKQQLDEQKKMNETLGGILQTLGLIHEEGLPYTGPEFPKDQGPVPGGSSMNQPNVRGVKDSPTPVSMKRRQF